MKVAFFIVLGITALLAARRIYEKRIERWPHGVISYAGAAAIITGAITVVLGVAWATMAGVEG